jgi:hypothetical protein
MASHVQPTAHSFMSAKNALNEGEWNGYQSCETHLAEERFLLSVDDLFIRASAKYRVSVYSWCIRIMVCAEAAKDAKRPAKDA